MSAAARSDSRTSSSSRKRLGRASNLGRITLLPTVPVAVRRSCLASAQRLLSFVRCGSLHFAPLLSPTPARAHGAADHGRAPAGRPAAVARVLARATAGSPRRPALCRHRLRARPSSPLAPTSTPSSAADAARLSSSRRRRTSSRRSSTTASSAGATATRSRSRCTSAAPCSSGRCSQPSTRPCVPSLSYLILSPAPHSSA